MTRSGSNTKNAILFAGVIMLAAACGGDRAQPEATNEFKKSVEEPSPQVQQVADRDPQALEIRTMHAPDTDAYCTFTQAAHTFVYDDPSTWRFVFLSAPAGETPSARIKINDEELAFQPADRTTDDEGLQTWRYRSDDRRILVEMKLKEAESGPENTDYTGTIAIIEPTTTERMRIKGGCGV
ncbi:hypothetical protein [Henriciella sp.]|uniref:hypothetical protein n=1 Tax=Henriciella sp. TaxID=1968823 RepID=UPI0018582730|nr:hypothetical protein [Henriciella sp.]HIG23646.1 hypothetical protein [Henriciella sp.]